MSQHCNRCGAHATEAWMHPFWSRWMVTYRCWQGHTWRVRG